MTDKTKTVIVPTVNLNGTSAESLIEQYCDAANKITEAIQALGIAAPHPRDFQLDRDSTRFLQARDEYRARIEKLQAVREELLQLAEGVTEQVSEREHQRIREKRT